jgi:lysozyme
MQIFFPFSIVLLMVLLFMDHSKIDIPVDPAYNQEQPIRPTPHQAIEIIKRYEGLRTHAYKDSNGIWTIGYGNTHEVHSGDHISEQAAEEQLRAYLQALGITIIKACRVPLNNNQYSALLSFVYNVGIGNFDRSNLLKLVNEKDEGRIVQEFLKWDHIQSGKEMVGLRARRLAEAALFFTPSGLVN